MGLGRFSESALSSHVKLNTMRHGGSSRRCQQMQKQGIPLTLAIFFYCGIVILLTILPKSQLGLRLPAVSSVTRFTVCEFIRSAQSLATL